MVEPHLPEHMVDGLNLYVEHGIEPGSFMMAVLENDLKEAVGRADIINIKMIPNIVAYLYNEVPRAAWGSPERVKNWIALHRAEREKKE